MPVGIAAGPSSPRTAIPSGSLSAERSLGRFPEAPVPEGTAPRRRVPRCVTAEARVAPAGDGHGGARGRCLNGATTRQGCLLPGGEAEAGRALRQLTRRFGVPFLVND